MRHADHRALGDAGHLVDAALDLGRVDVVAAADDQVLAAADDRDVAAVVDLADVAGLEPAVGGELLARLLGHAPVAREDVRARAPRWRRSRRSGSGAPSSSTHAQRRRRAAESRPCRRGARRRSAS